MVPYPIYLDGHASAPLAPEARDAMIAAWDEPGNPASPHRAGERAARIVEAARASVAALVGASPGEIVFTSGATEANNLAILGTARRAMRVGERRRRIVVSAIEHKSVLAPVQSLRSAGFEIDIAPVHRDGRVDLDALRGLIGPDTLLVSIMAANNETGVLQPVAEASGLARTAGALLHVDAAQAAGKIAIDAFELDVDYMSLSAHKLHGPMGVGALYVAAGSPHPEAILLGGGQQKGLRSGTEPAPLLAGFGAAAKLAAERMEGDAIHRRRLAEALIDALGRHQVRYKLTTEDAPTLPGSLSLLLHGINGEDLCQSVAAHVSISTGSACNAGQVEPSHVLKAMRIDRADIGSVVRVFCGRYNSISEMDAVAFTIAAAVRNSALAAGEVRQ